MVKKIIGIRHSSGEFNGVSYDNYQLHCVDSSKSDREVGLITSVETIKRSRFLEIFKKEPNQDMINKKYELYYDKNGKVDQMIVLAN